MTHSARDTARQILTEHSPPEPGPGQARAWDEEPWPYEQQPGTDDPGSVPDDTGDQEAGDQADAEWDFIRAVEAKKFHMRVDREAKSQLASEDAPEIPASFSGADFLSQPEDNPAYRINGLWPFGGKVMITAQHKAGKTTATHNVVRCLTDGVPFLNRFDVQRPDGRIFLVDAELPPDTARRWLKAQRIRSPERFEYQNIKGAASTFNLLDERCRDQWAERLKAAETGIFILDCLSPVLSACGMEENSPTDVRRFLNALDQLLAQASVSECAVVHHMGHSGERARGASSLLDWPDASIRLVRQDEDPSSPRFMSAFGRDVDVAECALAFDDTDKHITISGGSRKDAKADAALTAIVQLLTAGHELSGNAIEKELALVAAQKDIRNALKKGLQDKQLTTRPGERRATLWSVSSSVRQSSLPVRQRSGVQFVSSSIGDELN